MQYIKRKNRPSAITHTHTHTHTHTMYMVFFTLSKKLRKLHFCQRLSRIQKDDQNMDVVDTHKYSQYSSF